MTAVRKVSVVLSAAALAVTLGAAGCGKTTSMDSPMSPSSSSLAVAPLSGASIAGSIVPARQGVFVKVVGGAVSATADAAGRFQLNGIPAGNVSLQMLGPGVSSTAAVGPVANQERLMVTVQMSGSSATVDVDERIDAEDNAEVEGLIGSVDTSAQTFVVGSATVQVTSSTMIQSHGAMLTFSDLKAGERVEVEGMLQSSVVMAQKIEVHDVMAPPSSGVVEHKGTVASVTTGTSCGANNLSFTLSDGTLVTTTSTTAFNDGSCASIAAGARVEVKGTLTGTTIAATRVTIDEEGGDAEADIEGTIAATPAPTACPTPSFTVNGVAVTTSASTRFDHGTCASAVAGARVEVEGSRSSSGVVAAMRVTFGSD
jgi:hypothetical protein